MAALFVFGFLATTLVANNWPNRPMPPAHSTVLINATGSLGSGVHINSGYVITAAHVVGDDTRVKVTTEDGVITDGVVIWKDTANDVAVISTSISFPESNLSCAPPTVRERVELVGNPLGIRFIHSFGRVARVKMYEADNELFKTQWPGRFFLSAPVAPGMSGGPVFNEHGDVIGIVVAVFHTADDGSFSLAIAVQSATICNLLRKHN